MEGKEIHRRVMIGMGLVTTASGLAAGYLAFGKGGDLPSLMYGRWSSRAEPARPVVRRAARPLVEWRAWDARVLREARKLDRLVLLQVNSTWSRPCRVMDELAWSDPKVAAFVKEKLVAVRVDSDSRPDLATRYLSGWPTTALLLPSGEILDAATFMAPDLFLRWAQTLERRFRERRAGVMEAAEKAARSRAMTDDKTRAVSPEQAMLAARVRVGGDWDASTWGFGRGARFPRFERIRALSALGEDWARETARRASEGALKLEDPVWGGFYRYAEGPGWEKPQYEKRLEDQAEAVLALSSLEPEAAGRALAYVEAFLTDPQGGYYNSQAPELSRGDGRIIEGGYYFALEDARRRRLGLPRVDKRIFSGPSARMARAVLEAGALAGEKGRAQALKTLERLWRERVKGGTASREARGGPVGLLEDQVLLGEANLAAYRATGERRFLERATAVARAVEAGLVDRRSQALYDRPAAGELPDGLDRLLAPRQNAEALFFYRRLLSSLPAGDPLRPRLALRAEALRAWLSRRQESLDPAEWALLMQAG